jgi:serine protease SohB
MDLRAAGSRMLGMGHFWLSWGTFAADVVTLVGLLALAAVVVGRLVVRGRHGDEGHLEVRDLGRRQDEMSRVVSLAMLPKSAGRRARRAVGRAVSPGGGDRPRLYVLTFTGDLRATRTVSLREEITAVLSVATARDEVLLRLHNPGGTVHEQGFAASQLLRLRSRGVPLTVAVDTMAASGGYLMASVANRIVAAPFAILGSIGVITVVPKVHRLLERAGVEVEQYTAGRYKRTVTPYGRTTEEGRSKLTEELADTHELFKSWVAEHRPQVDIEQVGTGEHWYGSRAVQLGLVDELITSDDYIVRARAERDISEVRYRIRIPPTRRLFTTLSTRLRRTLT